MTHIAAGLVAMRAQMILLSAWGYSAQAIAEIQDAAKVTVYKWIDRFDEEGPTRLYDQEHEGRPRKHGPDAEEELERVLEGRQSRKVTTQAGRPPQGWPNTSAGSLEPGSTQTHCAVLSGAWTIDGSARARQFKAYPLESIPGLGVYRRRESRQHGFNAEGTVAIAENRASG